MNRLPLSPPRRDRIAIALLLAALLFAFPVLGSLLGSWFAPNSVRTPLTFQATTTRATGTPAKTAAASPTMTETAEPDQGAAAAPTETATRVSTQTPAPTPTSTPPTRVYIFPYRQVFADGQSSAASTPFLMYDNENQAFEYIGAQGTFVHLQTPDAKASFWTAIENLSTIPPAKAQYDFTVRGKIAQRVHSIGLACELTSTAVPALAPCQALPDFTTAKLISRITSGQVSLYLAEVNGKSYFIPAEDLSIP